MDQKVARSLVPPKAYIWRGLTRGQWCGHLPPYRRLSKAWGVNETAACLWVIRELWRQHIEANALDDTACFVEGLMAMTFEE